VQVVTTGLEITLSMLLTYLLLGSTQPPTISIGKGREGRGGKMREKKGNRMGRTV